MSLILMTTLLYKALILQGEIWCWSLLGLKGLNTTVITTQIYLRLNHIPFRLKEENFACSRLRDGRVCESVKARTRNKTTGRPPPPRFPRSRAHIFPCVSPTRHFFYLRAWNRPNWTVLVGMVAHIYYYSLKMKHDYLNASYWAVLSCRNAYFDEQGESNLGVCEWKTCGKTSAFASYIFLKSVSGNTIWGSSCKKN